MFLRGDRTYVQGTQIIARAADTLSEGPWTLNNAKFARITANIVTFQTDPHPDAIGLVQFSNAGAIQDVHVMESAGPAPRKDVPMGVNCTRDIALADPACEYVFNSCAHFEDLLNAFVIALKAEHSRRFEKARDIWFTGLRGGDLPVRNPPREGQITLTMMRRLEGSPAHQTLWRCGLHSASGELLSQSAITFSFVPGSSSHDT